MMDEPLKCHLEESEGLEVAKIQAKGHSQHGEH